VCVCVDGRGVSVFGLYMLLNYEDKQEEWWGGGWLKVCVGPVRVVTRWGGAWCEGNRSQLHDNATIDGGRRGGRVLYIGIIKMPPPPGPWTTRVKRINQPGDMIFPATNSPLYAVQLLLSPEGIVKSDRQMARLYVIGRNNTTGPPQPKHYIIIIYNVTSVGTYTYYL